MKRIGIVAHSAEGGALCFITACREGQKLLGPHMHPEIVLGAIPMGLSLPGWESDDHEVVASLLRRGRAIFDELCQGVFLTSTTAMFVDAIRELDTAGADCVILGCTEIPLIVNDHNSPLPVLDSTRLLATYAVREAISARASADEDGWLAPLPAPATATLQHKGVNEEHCR